MSVTVYWRPVPKLRHRFEGGTSTSWQRLQNVFGEKPTLGGEAVPILRAMAAASQDVFYAEVADRIEAAGEIELWGVY